MKKDYTEIDKVAFEMFSSGISLTKISKKMKIGRGAMTKRLKEKFDIEIIPNGRKYKVDDFVFNKINSEEKAYWAGFIFADGCIRNKYKIIEINLSEKDVNHLNKLNKFLKSDYLIKQRYTSAVKNGQLFKSYRLYFVSAQICNDLKKIGCIENKTYLSNDIFCFNDYNLDRAFIRGIFDGDGSLSKIESGRVTKLTFSAHTKELLESIVNRISFYTGVLECKYYMRTVGSWSVSFKMDSVRKILFFMYDNSYIYLDRKYHIYKDYAAHIGNFVSYEWAKSVKPFVIGNTEESVSASVENRS